MKDRVNLNLRRYLTEVEFRRELLQLKVYRGNYLGDDLFDWWERTGLVRPAVRVTWPEPIARRWWHDGHDYAGAMNDPVEPDGARLDAAVALARNLGRVGIRGAHGDAPHPLDDPEPEWEAFVQLEADQVYVRRADRRYPVGNARDPILYDRGHVRDYYSAWQVLAAAEIAEMGVLIRLDMTDDDVRYGAHDALTDGRAPDGPAFELFAPTEALNGLREHRPALDATIWASEEGQIALVRAARGLGGGRVRLGEAAAAQYHEDRIAAAKTALIRYRVSQGEIVALCRFLAERWVAWDRDGRPLIAEGYRIHLTAAVRLLQLALDLSFEQVAAAVGEGQRVDVSLLREVWPDWAAEQRDRVTMTLRPSLPTNGPGAVSDAELAAFAQFLEDERQDAFFLRLASFESNAFDSDAPSPMTGMASDLQGMAVAVEHVVRAMGGSQDQLYEMFKQLWAGTDVEPLLKKNAQLARNAALMHDWPALKVQIAALAAGGESHAVAATLVTAHRLRGAVHVPLPEDDQIELERLFVALMAAAAMTHAHLARQTALAGLPMSPATATATVAIASV
ncbi:hypothetical protein [Sphingomonas sp. GC_Shp_2]|nr:hypothetical protein [Sphingomonas sp. GC_Shp_2]